MCFYYPFEFNCPLLFAKSGNHSYKTISLGLSTPAELEHYHCFLILEVKYKDKTWMLYISHLLIAIISLVARAQKILGNMSAYVACALLNLLARALIHKQ